MIIGSIMMCLSGLVFAESTDFTYLLIAAIIGVISPSGDETGPFKTVEEASIAHLTPHNHRPEVFAIHGVLATAGGAIGSLVCGFLVDYLHNELKYDKIRCYQIVFYVYSAIAIMKLFSMLCLSEKCEVYSDKNISEISETSELLGEENSTSTTSTTTISKATRSYLPKLLCIFMLDSLGYGFMPSAWVVYYLAITFKLAAKALGSLFFVTNFVNSISSIPSAYLAKSIGPVKAILFTQAPSAIFFGAIAICHNFTPVAILLIFYYLTSTMDVVPRQVLLTSIMPKHEITKVMGTVNIGKTVARCVGPTFTGRLAEDDRLKYGFLINAICVLLADLVLVTNFVHVDHVILQKQSIDCDIE
ncbi:hypothetical protein KGF56_003633 [Candida oxycetoniae]|uniref:Major facilitator superfamily (MFS) profile domain-containing protein n=1 Tax=Candida oxycetoniae TaxID=497107 RepID=A0AAI9SV30_9ASCO|nr:uncharacterized protein KGF56_003633 [Candida oxycetoniae]KAI3403588.2 hypothetical protein KGF56_003633 [Candida oxycetoniae]